MFSIIHAAEAIHRVTYVAALLSVFIELSKRAPGWAFVVLMRVLNDDDSQLQLVDQLPDAPQLVKTSIKLVCERINNESAKFLAKTTPVMIAASR